MIRDITVPAKLCTCKGATAHRIDTSNSKITKVKLIPHDKEWWWRPDSWRRSTGRNRVV
jgi:hypothetical protein